MSTRLLGLGLVTTRRRGLASAQVVVSRPRWTTPARTVLAIAIGLCALVVWSTSLQSVNVRAMTDLGMVSVLPSSCLVALGSLTLGFCLALGGRGRGHPAVLLGYLLVLIFMLYAMPALVEQAPRFQVTYWLAGHTEYVLRTGSVNPFLDAYFNWPGFFTLTGLLTKITGFQSVLAFASWASFAFNLMYLAPMYLIYTTATRDPRLIWLGLWIFYITDWVWQDYFAPQGLNFFLYLVIVAIILKWFSVTREVPTPAFSLQTIAPRAVIAALLMRCRMVWARVRQLRRLQAWKQRDSFPLLVRRFRQWAALSDVPYTPEQRRQRIALLSVLILVFGLSVFSHPITPLFVLLSLTALTLFRRSMPRWLPIVFAVIILGWDFTVASPYMAGHLQSDLAEFGNLQVVTTSNVTDRLGAGSAEHQFIAQARVITTGVVWGMALLGAALRWRLLTRWFSGDASGARRNLFSHDLTFVLLVVAPGFLVIAQPYGGEMAMRYYMMSLPFVAFFAASALCTPIRGRGWRLRWSTVATTAVTAAACLILLAGFMFARYGNERADYMTYNESEAVNYLYSVAPPGSLLLQGWSGTPWRHVELEKYDYFPLYPGYGDANAIKTHNIQGIVDRAARDVYAHLRPSGAWVIFTRSQKAQAQMFYGVSPSDLDAIENALLRSGAFVLVYSNPDADVLMYVHSNTASASGASASGSTVSTYSQTHGPWDRELS